MSIIKYLPYILPALLVGFISYLMHTVSVNNIEKQNAKEMAVQEGFIRFQCQESAKTTGVVDENAQNRYNDLAAKYKRLQQQASTSKLPATNNTSINNAASQNGATGPISCNGGDLLELGNDGEWNGISLTGAQELICRVWILNNQPVPETCNQYR